MNDKMVPEGLVLSFLMSGIVPSLHIMNKLLPGQRKRMKVLSTAQAEMGKITAELLVAQESGSRLPLATHFTFTPADEVRVYKEQGKH